MKTDQNVILDSFPSTRPAMTIKPLSMCLYAELIFIIAPKITYDFALKAIQYFWLYTSSVIRKLFFYHNYNYKAQHADNAHFNEGLYNFCHQTIYLINLQHTANQAWNLEGVKILPVSPWYNLYMQVDKDVINGILQAGIQRNSMGTSRQS